MIAIARFLVHLLFRLREFNNRLVGEFAKSQQKRKILELGSGKAVDGVYSYSAKHLFDPSNEFIQSDINSDFGHPIVDVTTMTFRQEFDVILCLNVLEHVYDFKTAVKNIYEALKPGGTVVILVPTFYPLHDEPHDYWRFTEHSLRRLLVDFKNVKLQHKGFRQYPLAYYLEATKN